MTEAVEDVADTAAEWACITGFSDDLTASWSLAGLEGETNYSLKDSSKRTFTFNYCKPVSGEDLATTGTGSSAISWSNYDKTATYESTAKNVGSGESATTVEGVKETREGRTVCTTSEEGDEFYALETTVWCDATEGAVSSISFLFYSELANFLFISGQHAHLHKGHCQ